jgi:hypothetical protein
MPVRWRSKFGRRGRVSTTLADWSSAITGTITVAAPITGHLQGSFSDWIASLSGVSQPSTARTGVITATLADWVASLTGTENYPVSWVDGLGDSFTITAGVPFSYTFQAYDPDGDIIDIIQNSISPSLTVSEAAQAGFYKTITISSPGYPGGSGLSAGTYTASLDLVESSTWEEDWADRSTAAGVVWAHRFNDQQTANFLYVVRDDFANHGTPTITTTGGIIGDGCLSLPTPAGKYPGIGWVRPLAPMVAGTAYGYGADINNAGLPTIAPHTWFGTDMNRRIDNARGGFFGHADYYDPTVYPGFYSGTAPPEWVQSGPFWIQYRMKVSASRFATGEVNGKVMMLEAAADSSNSVEYVQGLGANTSSHQKMYHYNDVGALGLAVAGHTWAVNTWYTIQYKVTPGHVGQSDTGIQLRIAAAGATSWTTLLNRTDIPWNYVSSSGYPPWPGGIGGTLPIPYGWNILRLTTFNGGSDETASVNGYTTDYDQVICSTQEIALPVY